MPPLEPSASKDGVAQVGYVYLEPAPWPQEWPWLGTTITEWFWQLWNTLVDVWNYVWDMAHGIWDALTDTVGWTGERIWNIWDWFVDKFHWLYDRLWDVRIAVGGIVAAARDWLRDRINDAWHWVRDHVTAARNWLGDYISSLWTSISDAFGTIWAWIRDHVTAARDTITSWITSARDWLRDRINDAWGWLSGHVSNVYEWLSGQISNVYDWLHGHISNVYNWIRDWITAARDTITSWITSARDWIGDEIIDPWTDWLHWVVDRIHETISGWWESLKLWFLDLWQSVVQLINVDLVDAIGRGLTWLTDRLRSIIMGFIEGLQGVGAGYSPILPEDVPAIFGQLVAVGLAGVGAITLLQAGVELLHPTHNLGLGHISAIIFEFTQYRLVCGIFVGAMLGALLREPARYYFNRMFRPTLPTWAELQAMARKHELSRAEFYDAMAYHGFTDDWITHIWHYMWADPRLYDILRLADVATPEFAPVGAELIERLIHMGIDPASPDWWLQMKFMLAGYEDVDIKALTDVVHKREVQNERTRLVTQIRHMFYEGYWDQATASDAMTRAGLRSNQIAMTLLGETYRAQNDMLDDRVMTATTRFRRDSTTEAEYRAELATYIIRAERVDAIADLEVARKLVKPPAVKVTPPKPLYQRPEGKAAVQEAIVLYRGAIYTDEQLLTALLAQEMPLVEAQAIVGLESARRRVKPEPKPPPVIPFYETDEGRVRVHTLRVLFRGQLLEESETLLGLQDLGMAVPYSQAILEDELAYIRLHPPPAPPPRPPLYRTDEGRERLRLYKLQFAENRIDVDTFGDLLLALEMSADMAGAIVDYAVLRKAKMAPPPPPPPPPLYRTDEGRAAIRLHTEQFRRDIITSEEFGERLVALQMTPEQAAYIVEYEIIKKIPPPPPPPPPPRPYYTTAEGRAELRLATERYRRDVLDEGEFGSELLRLEMSPLMATAIVEYEFLRKE